MDISNYFRKSLGLRDNESRLYFILSYDKILLLPWTQEKSRWPASCIKDTYVNGREPDHHVHICSLIRNLLSAADSPDTINYAVVILMQTAHIHRLNWVFAVFIYNNTAFSLPE